jgi:hypothetical protein
VAGVTILAVVYASAPPAEVLIPTLEITHDSIAPIRLCAGFEDVVAEIEDGSSVRFEATAIGIALPKRDTSGQQHLTFALDGVSGIAQQRLDEALEAGGQVTITYRTYLASDLTAPAEPALVMTLVSGRFERATVQLQAAYYDLLNYAWPRDRYTAEFAPGIKYLAA